jgi:hypothetical protein
MDEEGYYPSTSAASLAVDKEGRSEDEPDRE